MAEATKNLPDLRVLVVATAAEITAKVKSRLSHDRVVVTSAPDVESAAKVAHFEKADLVVIDLDAVAQHPNEQLAEIQRLFPHATRALLAHSDRWQEALGCVPWTHQFLAKPLDPQQLDNLIRRVAGAAAFALPLPLRQAVGRLTGLPAAPAVLAALSVRLQQPGVRCPDVATVVRRDPAMACRVLQIANAGLFESSSRLCDVDGAIGLVGPAYLRRLVDAGTFTTTLPPGHALDVERACRHALVVATVAKSIFRDPRAAEAAFSAGLLHGIGWLTLAAAAPEEFALRQADPQAAQDGLMERVTGYVLQTWGLPAPLVAATADSHREPDEGTFSPASAVYLARKLAALVANARCGPLGPEPPLTNRFVQRHRLAKELPNIVDCAANAVETACRAITPLPSPPR